uniref:Lysosomal Pro-X carboxypeptidase-like n=1 Tax=Dermatophagoides pteronyssinus TaxID=6956 RepID=A0A6P6Y8D5_DERPT|nr:lysosomal Pro-X carboxypeptidase-like [Dermatophagoides pteronyssinus]
MKISFVYQSLILINLIIIFDIIDTLEILNLFNINRHHQGLYKSLSSSTPLLKGKVRNLHEKYYSQYVDHFSFTNRNTFKQRYLISTEHWKSPNGPIWFWAGNEGDVYDSAKKVGFIWDNAEKFQAMILFMEHRYYGKSIPYGKNSFKKLSNYGYLTVEQALDDYASFIVHIRSTMKGARSSPVVIIGGSYGGMLAAWFRIKYPHLCVGALASSAPFLHYPNIYDCKNYYRIATETFSNYSTNCSESIRRSWPAIRRLAKTNNGRTLLTKKFNLCEKFNPSQLESLIHYISYIWAVLPMMDNPKSSYPIKNACQYLNEPDSNDEQLITAIGKAYSVFKKNKQCKQLSGYGDMYIQKDSWDFQTCTELALPLCSDGVNDMFELSEWKMEQFSNDCHKKYGINPDPHKPLRIFGGKNIQHTATNIIFSNGLKDPWSGGSVLESLSDSLIAIKIPGACHCEDLLTETTNDTKTVLDAREQELQIIRGWFETYYEKKKIDFKF